MNNSLKLIMLALLSSTLCACAYSEYRPIVDGKNQNMSHYEQDLYDCQQLSKQVNPASNTAAGAGIGAGVGAVIGLLSGGHTSSLLTGAGIGAVSGGTGSTLSSNEKQKHVIIQCLRGRGYRIAE